MSAFIVEDKTINKIVTFLAIDRDGDWLRREIQKKTGFDLETAQGKSDFARALFRMNVAAVSQRYDDGVENFAPMTYQYQIDITITPITVFKALKCLRYQCSEGNVPETELYKLLEYIISALAEKIISNNPEYDKAYWG